MTEILQIERTNEEALVAKIAAAIGNVTAPDWPTFLDENVGPVSAETAAYMLTVSVQTLKSYERKYPQFLQREVKGKNTIRYKAGDVWKLKEYLKKNGNGK